jgi:RNA polymerase sigma-70 factor (ECF subfamily)
VIGDTAREPVYGMAKNVDWETVFLTGVKSCANHMFRIAYGILRHPADAEDAVGSSVLTAYAKIQTLKTADSFKPWIMKILVRECYAILRKRKKTDLYDQIPDIPVMEPYRDGELWNAVRQLEDKFRAVVMLFYYEDMSIETIAGILSLPRGTVKSRLSRARSKLRQWMTEGGLLYE